MKPASVVRKKRRLCAICGEARDFTRCFPSASKPKQQEQWVIRLGVSEPVAMDLLNRFRSLQCARKEVRWCDRHFSHMRAELPTDKRLSTPVKVVSAIVPQRAVADDKLDTVTSVLSASSFAINHDTQPSSHENNYGGDANGILDHDYAMRAPVIDNDDPVPLDDYVTFDDYSDDELMGSPNSSTPPRSPSPLARLPDGVGSGNDDSEIQPARMMSMMSLASGPTIERTDSTYVNSQVTIGSSEEEEEVVEGEEEGETKADFYICAKTKLLECFKFCMECGGEIDVISRELRECGSALTIKYFCNGCRNWIKWESQEKKGGEKSKTFQINHELPIAAFVSGCPFPRLADTADTIGIAIPRERTMRATIHDSGTIAIDRVHAEWQSDVRNLSKEAAPESGMTVSLDGQYGDPGHNASNCKVTVLDAKLKTAIAGVSLHYSELGIDKVSCRMESVGSERALEELINDGFNIKTRVTDCNAMVDKRLRENPKLQHIEVERDFWHVQKSLRKKWWKAMKKNANALLVLWYKPFFNHLFYVNQKYTKREDRRLALEHVRSFLFHCTGTHTWQKDDDFTLIDKCDHGLLADIRKRGKKMGKARKGKRPLIKEGSDEYKTIHELLYSKSFEKGFLASSPLVSTSLCECYHSLSLMYAPKRLACSAFYYNKKMKLAMLHHNCNVLGELLEERTDVGSTCVNRKGRIAIAIKWKMSKGNHVWRREIIEESWRVKEEMALIKRHGIPTDMVFDEIMTAYAKDKMAEIDEESEYYSEEE